MSAYAGVTFYVRMAAGGFVPEFSAEESPVVTHIPGSNVDDVQFGGRTNLRVSWTIRIGSLADYNTLRSAQGSTLRTLTKYDSTSVSNVMLVKLGPPQWHHEGDVLAEAEFMVGT